MFQRQSLHRDRQAFDWKENRLLTAKRLKLPFVDRFRLEYTTYQNE